jgi:NADH:ubiquinone oxidoreductase subunit 4 (subunit M)
MLWMFQRVFFEKSNTQTNSFKDLSPYETLIYLPVILLILVMGTAIAEDLDLNQAFWDKMEKLSLRESRMVNGRIRVSEFRDMD